MQLSLESPKEKIKYGNKVIKEENFPILKQMGELEAKRLTK